MPDNISYEDLKMCNCADCGRELLSMRHFDWWAKLSKEKRAALPPFVGERINDRPYCNKCAFIKNTEISSTRLKK